MISLPFEEIYKLYCRFEADFLAHCLRTTPLPSLRKLYRRTIQPMSRKRFRTYLQRLPIKGRRCMYTRWKSGFSEYWRKAEIKALRIQERIKRQGVPEDVQRRVEGIIAQLRNYK